VNTNGLIISRAVTTIAAFGYAASEVVQKGGHVFLSFPRTPSIDSLTLPDGVSQDDLVSDNNKRMRKNLAHWLPSGSHSVKRNIVDPLHPANKRLFIAWSGTTDKVDGDIHNPSRVKLQVAYAGILDTLRNGLVLPTVIWDRGEDKEPIFITGKMQQVKKAEDIERIQEWQRSTLARALGLQQEAVVVSN
jgi:hypothetical protein